MRGCWLGVLAILAACGGGSGGGGNGPPATQAEITSACVVAGFCLGDGTNDCFTDLIPILLPDEIRCIARARADCDAARACIGIRAAIVPSCTPGRICVGNDIVDCTDPPAQITTECGGPLSTGPTCLIGSNGQAQCGASTCSVESRACVGTSAQVCDTFRGVLRSTDCATRDLECVNGVCTSPGGGGACASGTPPRCDGTMVVTCSNNVESRIDCATKIAGATCVAVTTPFPDAFCATGSACYPEKGAETCSGTSLSFCAAGVPTTVDCTSLGFSMCLGGCRP